MALFTPTCVLISDVMFLTFVNSLWPPGCPEYRHGHLERSTRNKGVCPHSCVNFANLCVVADVAAFVIKVIDSNEIDG
jgi:hypothetical protein